MIPPTGDFEMRDLTEHAEQRTITAVAAGIAPRTLKSQLIQHLADSGNLESLQQCLPSPLLRQAREIISRCKDLFIDIVPFSSERYPLLLRSNPAPPTALYLRTSTPNFAFPARMIAIVGTRAASVEMCQHTSQMSLHLAQHGLPVVSGLALGVDGAAHRGALAASIPCPTIAVLAHGLDRLYPSSHAQLAESILSKGGALVSEYPPGTEPLKHHFLERNRIIAALALGVVVVQAGERSGSLVTARYAADFGRDVFVMESADGDSAFSGGAQLIEDGAIPVAGAREILEEYGIRSVQGSTDHPSAWETVSLDEYLKRTGHSTADILRLEVAGHVIRLPGNRVSIMLR
jgi:DNA protecting protein DprA